MAEGIWLEVAEVRYDSKKKVCSVLLKGDREQPKPDWRRVKKGALKKGAFKTYKAVLEEMDKKRVALARLSCSKSGKHFLRCDAFRFQTPDLGGR